MSKADTQRSTAEIQAELAQSRAKLAADVEGLIDDLNPKNVARRAVEDAKTLVTTEFEAAKAQIKDEDGWRVDRLVVIGTALAGCTAFILTLRAIIRAFRRNRS